MRQDNDAAPDTDRSLRRVMLFGLLVLAALFGGAGAWAARTEIAGAVIASATIVVDSNAKKVQHLEGGIVEELLVRDGHKVEAGDILLKLNDAETHTTFNALSAQIDELLVEKARLEAERDQADALVLPPELEGRVDDEALSRIIRGQRRLLTSRRQGIEGQKSQLDEQITQLGKQISGIEAQAAAKDRQIEIATDELKGLEPLRRKRLVQTNRLTALERELAQLQGDRGQLISDAARLEGLVTETRLKIIQLDEERRSEVLTAHRDVRSQLSTLREQRAAASARLSRLDVVAPRAGTVHQLAVHTVGGVITPGEPLMLIVPQDDALVLQAQVRPEDVDQVRAGQAAYVRFPAFDQRTTPELDGMVERVGADLSYDPVTELPFFEVRIRIAEEELKKLGDKRLRPGLPAEVFIRTEMRTALSYLVKPISDQIAHAFRE